MFFRARKTLHNIKTKQTEKLNDENFEKLGGRFIIGLFGTIGISAAGGAALGTTVTASSLIEAHKKNDKNKFLKTLIQAPFDISYMTILSGCAGVPCGFLLGLASVIPRTTLTIGACSLGYAIKTQYFDDKKTALSHQKSFKK